MLSSRFPTIDREVKKKIVHRRYQCVTFAFDIALLKVDPIIETPKFSTTKFPEHIKPIALPCQERKKKKGKKGKFGRMSTGSEAWRKQKDGSQRRGANKKTFRIYKGRHCIGLALIL